jgi:hypothetical protein
MIINEDDSPKFFLRVTLSEPTKADGTESPAFSPESEQAIADRRPEFARSWAIQLPAAHRCVLRTTVEASTEREAVRKVLHTVKSAFAELEIRPSHVNVRGRSGYVEVGRLA